MANSADPDKLASSAGQGLSLWVIHWCAHLNKFYENGIYSL